MEIYVRITDEYGLCSWYNYNEQNGQGYLYDAAELENWNTGLRAGTPCKSVISAKLAGRSARRLADFDGAFKPKVTYFRYVGGKLVETKFTKDNKIKR